MKSDGPPSNDPQTPTVGDGVTVHERGACLPGVITRLEESSFWFELDRNGPAHPGAPRWSHRAVLTAEGNYREGHDMWLVEVGVRRFADARPLPPPGRRSMTDLKEAVLRIEPFLLKTAWYPMSYMLIPSVLASADSLLDELSKFAGNESDRARARVLWERLAKLRRGFRRVVPRPERP